jgi:hypothetical protein
MELLQAAIEYKAMANREAERRRRLGITYVDPNAPHPDDVVIDMHTGDVAVCHNDFKGAAAMVGRSTRLFANSDAPTAALRVRFVARTGSRVRTPLMFRYAPLPAIHGAGRRSRKPTFVQGGALRGCSWTAATKPTLLTQVGIPARRF